MTACAVVTGATGGIGAAICARLAKAGMAVLGVDLVEPAAGHALERFVRVDLAELANSAAEMSAFATSVSHWLGGRPLELLVNNAAVQRLGTTAELDRAAWRESLDVNLLAPFFLTQALLSQLETAHGCIVNISSVHAKATKPRFVAYATTNAALSGLTRALAVDVGREVRVYGIEPAAVLTDMLRTGFAGSPESMNRLAACHPSGEIASPEQIAEVVQFLSSSRIAALEGSAIEIGGGIIGRLHDPD
jgi:NAD(P)-dependent dehydrogenase (short-subunit alcohol dehydrogenase family)